jgi:hypothetical protein
MHVDLIGLTRGPVLTAAVFIRSDEFLLLGVHADHRLTSGQRGLDRRVDVAELGVTVRVPAAIQRLGVRLQAEPLLRQQPPDRVIGHRVPLGGQLRGQGPTAGVVIAPAVLASVSGGGGALVELVAAVDMSFVAYAFVIFTRGFNSAGSVYGFTGAVAGPLFGFVSAWTLMLVYVSFAGGTCAVTAAEAGPAFGTVGLHLSWQVHAPLSW